jgi:hypothetical protein
MVGIGEYATARGAQYSNSLGYSKHLICVQVVGCWDLGDNGDPRAVRLHV